MKKATQKAVNALFVPMDKLAAQAKATARNTMQNTTTTSTTFEKLKTDFTKAYAIDPASPDTTAAVYALATAAAASVVKKCIDPQRKTATTRDTVSNNGMSPALVALRREIYADTAAAANVSTYLDTVEYTTLDKGGDIVQTAAAAELIPALVECFGDGIDLVHTAVVALLEVAAAHATADPAWIDTPYTTRRRSKRVVIDGKVPDMVEVDTTPIQEVYRAVRRDIMRSRAVQTDPRNGYTYISDMSDGMDTVYYRMGKYADLGGYDCNGNYTADPTTAADYYGILEKLALTDKQSTAVMLRMRGYGYKAIGGYMGIRSDTVRDIFKAVQRKALLIGLDPAAVNV